MTVYLVSVHRVVSPNVWFYRPGYLTTERYRIVTVYLIWTVHSSKIRMSYSHTPSGNHNCLRSRRKQTYLRASCETKRRPVQTAMLKTSPQTINTEIAGRCIKEIQDMVRSMHIDAFYEMVRRLDSQFVYGHTPFETYEPINNKPYRKGGTRDKPCPRSLQSPRMN